MQRTTFIATITLALALTSALGVFVPSSYVKAPVVVIQENETNFTNNADTSYLRLASVTIGDVYVTANNLTQNLTSINNNGWNVYFKKLEAKALTTTGSLLSYNFSTAAPILYVNNYAISFSTDKETSNSTNLVVFQVPLTGGAQVPKLTITNNTNDTAFVPSHVKQQIIGKVVYVFYLSADKTVNVTSFTVGGSLSTTKFTLTSNYTSNTLQVVWGEALGTSKLYAIWREGDALKNSAVDLSKGNATVANLDGFNATIHTCYAYTTDKNLFGDICTTTNTTDTDSKAHTRTYWVRTNNVTGLVPLATYNISNSQYNTNYPYAQYLVLDLVEKLNDTSNSYSYEIWNLDTRTLFKNRTLYLQIDTTTSVVAPFRVVSGGLYSLFYDKPLTNATSGVKGPITNIQVGLLLGGSYLVSVFGFLLTIIAGLLLF